MGAYLSLKENVKTLDLVKQHASSSKQRSPPSQLRWAGEGGSICFTYAADKKENTTLLPELLAS